MDTSKEYIKMCEKAVKVQKWWQKDGNIRGDETNEGLITELDEYYDDDTWKVKADDEFKYYNSRKLTWLPRQDQLQKIAFPDENDTINIWVNKFYRFCLEFPYKPGYLATACFTSMEQLWLAFVMKEKYNKVWDGKKWK